MQFYEINISQVIIFRFYAVYNKHEMIKIANKTREKLQLLFVNARIILLPIINCTFKVMS